MLKQMAREVNNLAYILLRTIVRAVGKKSDHQLTSHSSKMPGRSNATANTVRDATYKVVSTCTDVSKARRLLAMLRRTASSKVSLEH